MARRWLVRATSAVVALALAYVAVTAAQVWWASRRDERGPAGAIIVLGAAQYDGVPSPIFSARLDHGLALWQEGAAPVLVVTGGGRPGDQRTESSAAADYLIARGVPDQAILREVDARNTWESLLAVSRILDDRGIARVVLVSDPTHALRTDLIAADVGLDADVSPTRTSPASTTTALRSGARETAAVALGRLLGYRRVPVLQDLVARAEPPTVDRTPSNPASR